MPPTTTIIIYCTMLYDCSTIMVAVIFEIISTDSFSLPSINIVRKLKMSNFNCMMISSAGKLLMDTILFCLKLQDIAVYYNTVGIYCIERLNIIQMQFAK